MYNTWEQVRGKGDMKLGRDKERWGRRKGKGEGKQYMGNRGKDRERTWIGKVAGKEVEENPNL